MTLREGVAGGTQGHKAADVFVLCLGNHPLFPSQRISGGSREELLWFRSQLPRAFLSTRSQETFASQRSKSSGLRTETQPLALSLSML